MSHILVVVWVRHAYSSIKSFRTFVIITAVKRFEHRWRLITPPLLSGKARRELKCDSKAVNCNFYTLSTSILSNACEHQVQHPPRVRLRNSSGSHLLFSRRKS